MFKERGLKFLLSLGRFQTCVEPINEDNLSHSNRAKIMFGWEIEDNLTQECRHNALGELCQSCCPVREINGCNGGISVDGLRITCGGVKVTKNGKMEALLNSGAIIQNSDSLDTYEERDRTGMEKSKWKKVVEDFPCV